MDALVIPMHLGALHPVETLAMGVLALGPFVILAVVVTIVSRRDRRAEAQEVADAQATRDRSARWEAANSTTSETAAPQSVQE
jgi:cytochrome c-type biogenesis protein CcmH/NrfF